jgi:hypothetical protein
LLEEIEIIFLDFISGVELFHFSPATWFCWNSITFYNISEGLGEGGPGMVFKFFYRLGLWGGNILGCVQLKLHYTNLDRDSLQVSGDYILLISSIIIIISYIEFGEQPWGDTYLFCIFSMLQDFFSCFYLFWKKEQLSSLVGWFFGVGRMMYCVFTVDNWFYWETYAKLTSYGSFYGVC